MNDTDRQLEPWVRRMQSLQSEISRNKCKCCPKVERYRSLHKRQLIIDTIDEQKNNRATVDRVPPRFLFNKSKIVSQRRLLAERDKQGDTLRP